MRLSAALIVKDEQTHIRACLECLKPIADEVVVVDTGSRDGTAEIAAGMGAAVSLEPWRDDFAHARNAALDQASGDWILYVDADERVYATGDFRAGLTNPQAIAATVQFKAASKLWPYREHRLFRNRPDIRFRGVIHETVMPDITALVDRGAGIVVDAALRFEHLGYDGDLRHKHRRNLPLLRRAVADNPARTYLWHTLGEALHGLGDEVRAEAAWREGLARVRVGAHDPADVLIYNNLLSLHLDENGVDLADAQDLLAEMDQRHRDDPLTIWVSARFLAAQGDFPGARSRAERLLELASTDLERRGLGYSRELFGAFPWALMGTCWLREGHPRRARDCLRRAEQADPTNLEIRVKRVVAEQACSSWFPNQKKPETKLR